MVAKANVGPWFLYWNLFFARGWFNSRANGAAQQNISRAIVASYRFTNPSVTIISAFNDLCEPMHRTIRSNAEKIQTLNSIRNTLLPRLISGKLRVSENEPETPTL
jgi:type I restriction enzyme S subunit